MANQRVLPRLTPDNHFFWTSGADGRLRFLQCQDCSGFIHPPQPLCPHCRSEQVVPTAVAGTGIVDTFTVNRQKWRPDLEVPYVIARVAIDGAAGVILTTNIMNCSPDEVNIGDRVRVMFEQDEDVYIPLFEKLA